MRVTKGVETAQRGETREPEVDTHGGAANAHAPRKMTFAENVLLTIKVLGTIGLLGAALWGMSLWTSDH